MISFDPTPDQKLMRDTVAELAKSALLPRMRQTEAARDLPAEARSAVSALGLAAAAFGADEGGAGLGLLTAVMIEEELAAGDAAAAFAVPGPHAFGVAVAELGTKEQAALHLGPFFEGDNARFGAVAWGEPKAHAARPGLCTLATRVGDAWELSGHKAYVIGADRADVFVVFAQIDEAQGWNGLGAFVVNKSAPGVSVGSRATTLGLDAASFGEVTFDKVRVTDEARLQGNGNFTASLVRFFCKNALTMAARSVGLVRAAFDTALAYCETRKAFGKPIGHFQAVAFNLADRAMDVEAARTMVLRAASAWDAGDAGAVGLSRPWDQEAMLLSAQAISFSHEAAMRCGDDGVQLHGGAGFIRDYAAEKYMRDAKQLQLCGMTAEHADQLAANIELGQPFDLGLVLPSAETQSAFV
jgi:alkylation response protein AidB-like acyl-CoA dehydrogenase